jgi:hypothetical protein
MTSLRSDAVLWRFVAHDGSEGLSPDGWLPDRISIGVLTRVFTPELVDAAVEGVGVREQRRRLLSAPLVAYFTLALWLFQGRNCCYRQVMVKLADGLYHQRRAADLLEGRLDPDGWVDAGEDRRWRPPNISNLSRGRGKLGPEPLRNMFLQVADPTGTQDTPGAFCRRPVLRSKDPAGVQQEMWALFAVYQALCKIPRSAQPRWASPWPRSASPEH